MRLASGSPTAARGGEPVVAVCSTRPGGDRTRNQHPLNIRKRVRLHDQGGGPTGARTTALSASASAMPGTERALSMNRCKTVRSAPATTA